MKKEEIEEEKDEKDEETIKLRKEIREALKEEGFQGNELEEEIDEDFNQELLRHERIRKYEKDKRERKRELEQDKERRTLELKSINRENLVKKKLDYVSNTFMSYIKESMKGKKQHQTN